MTIPLLLLVSLIMSVWTFFWPYITPSTMLVLSLSMILQQHIHRVTTDRLQRELHALWRLQHNLPKGVDPEDDDAA